MAISTMNHSLLKCHMEEKYTLQPTYHESLTIHTKVSLPEYFILIFLVQP